MWWSYVWHELKRQVLPPVTGTGTGLALGLEASDLGGHFGTVSLFESDNQARLVSNKLKDNLRSSAVLLASTRQVYTLQSSCITPNYVQLLLETLPSFLVVFSVHVFYCPCSSAAFEVSTFCSLTDPPLPLYSYSQLNSTI